jgi:hypothetical protein
MLRATDVQRAAGAGAVPGLRVARYAVSTGEERIVTHSDVARLRSLLEPIAEGLGTFRLDNYEFAQNVIEESKVAAREALTIIDAAGRRWLDDENALWICEQHPDRPFEHNDCPGPGMLLRDHLAAREVEMAGLRTLWRSLATSFFDEEVGELDESAFFDACAEAGFMEPVKYDPAIHGEDLVGDPEKGDDICVITALGQRLRNEPADARGQ